MTSNWRSLLAGFILCTIAFAAMASWRGDLIKGGITSDGLNVDIDKGYFQVKKGFKIYNDTSSLTVNPSSTAIAVGNIGSAEITASSATTGITLTGAELDQVVVLIGTSDSNTARIDDGASYLIGGNKTLGKDDVLALQCIDASTPKFRALFYQNN